MDSEIINHFKNIMSSRCIPKNFLLKRNDINILGDESFNKKDRVMSTYQEVISSTEISCDVIEKDGALRFIQRDGERYHNKSISHEDLSEGERIRASFHTHPNFRESIPSPRDIENFFDTYLKFYTINFEYCIGEQNLEGYAFFFLKFSESMKEKLKEIEPIYKLLLEIASFLMNNSQKNGDYLAVNRELYGIYIEFKRNFDIITQKISCIFDVEKEKEWWESNINPKLDNSEYVLLYESSDDNGNDSNFNCHVVPSDKQKDEMRALFSERYKNIFDISYSSYAA